MYVNVPYMDGMGIFINGICLGYNPDPWNIQAP